MLWYILTFMGTIFISSETPTGERPAEGIIPAEPIEFIFKDVLLPEYYNEEKQIYDPDINDLRQRGLVPKHSDIHPNDFEYIEPYLRETWSRDPIQLDMIDDNNMFLQLKEFWKQERPDVPDIDADRLFSFIRAVDFLRIRRDACKRFARNMARKGLLGTHSHDILGRTDKYLRGHEIYWNLFLGFAAELGCEVRVSDQTMTFCSTGSRYGTILEAKPKTEMNKLRIVPNAFSRNKNVGTHIAHHLVWFLWHLDLHGLDLSGCKMNRNDVDAFKQALFRIGDVGLQAMNISQCSMSSGGLAIILPCLKDLTKLDVSHNSLSKADCDAFAACTSLTELDIKSCFGNSPGYLAIILPHLENLIKLDASDNSFNEADRDAFATCTLLTELKIRSCFRNSPGNIAMILPCLKDLTKLYVQYNRLNKADCDAFAACKSLTELGVRCCFERSPGYLAIILPHLENLIKLDASDNSLNEKDCRAIARCTQLAKLKIRDCFKNSPGHLAMILPHLKDSLIKLDAHGNSLSEADCRAFAGYTELTELSVGYCFEKSPGYLAIILPHLENLIKLDASDNSFNEADCRAIARCTQLAKLDIKGCFRNSPGSVAIILPHLKDSLIKLDAHGNNFNEADRDALARCTKLIELYIGHCLRYLPGSVAIILPHLKDLTKLYASYNGFNEKDRDALAECTKLTELYIKYCLRNGYLATILPHLKNLIELGVYSGDLNRADKEAIKAAGERGVKLCE
jgi:Leucine-rich repeat (LRR) protein